MNSNAIITVSCPSCGHEFPLNEAVLCALREGVRKEMSSDVFKREQQIDKKLGEVRSREVQLRQQALELDAELQKQLQARLKEAEARARRLAEDSLALKIQDMESRLEAKTVALKAAQLQELDLRSEQRRLKEEREAMEIEVARKLDSERSVIRHQISEQLEEQSRFKLADREKVIEDLRREMDALQRKAQQGSQQNQGEVMEIDFATSLAAAFPFDLVDEVQKGVRGADVSQTVVNPKGRDCGAILYETKRTKAWAGSWIPKLKEDMRNANAEIGVIVTETLPEEVKRFGYVDGVWVSDYVSALPLATSLRWSLLQLSIAKLSREGAKEKTDLLYTYLTGAEFRRRVEGVIEAFTSMKDDLEAEKRALTKHWSKREKQLSQVMDNMAAMYGDIQGISGNALQEVKALNLCE